MDETNKVQDVQQTNVENTHVGETNTQPKESVNSTQDTGGMLNALQSFFSTLTDRLKDTETPPTEKVDTEKDGGQAQESSTKESSTKTPSVEDLGLKTIDIEGVGKVYTDSDIDFGDQLAQYIDSQVETKVKAKLKESAHQPKQEQLEDFNAIMDRLLT